jgi:putative membrane protein
MRWHFITTLLVIAPCTGALAAQDTTQAQKPTQNQDTLTIQESGKGRWGGALNDDLVLSQMHRTNLMEIRMGQLAQKNGSSAKVKQFAARLVRDHQAADQKVVAVAKQLGIALPTMQDKERGTTGQADTTYRQESPQADRDGQELRSLHGAAFDTAFANAMVKGHENAVNLLELAQGQVQHEEVKSLIASTLPTLREHLQIAQSLAGVTTTSSSQ